MTKEKKENENRLRKFNFKILLYVLTIKQQQRDLKQQA